MDYLDPQKQRRHGILLLVGYVFMTIAIVTATVILVYQAYGFGIDKNGEVIQNGIVFFSSQPNPAQIYVNDKRASADTNARLALPANIYKIRLTRVGYVDWQRPIEVDGGSVTHFDYPLLLPKVVKTTTAFPLTALPGLATQSPDRRWLVTNDISDPDNFAVYDLKNPTKAAVAISLPADLATKATSAEQWQNLEWADDNQHLLLQHTTDGVVEFILLDRQNPDQSVNLNKTLNSSPSAITLINKKYDQYHLYNGIDHSLQTASLKNPTATPLLNGVLAYKAYSDDTVLFFTNADATAGKVLLKEQVGNRTIQLRSFPTSSHYLVDLATYNGTPYVIASSADENKVYIFKDPVAQLAAHPTQVIVPIQVLRVIGPDYESFSDTAQFIMAEHGNQIASYDLQNKNGYNYDQAAVKAPLSAPQTHATWMDGNRLTYVSVSKTADLGTLQILDYDQANQRAFVPSSPSTLPFFSPDFKNVYTFVPTASGASLSATSLRTPADQ